MIAAAEAKFQRISPRKARVIIDLIRGRDAGEVLELLDFLPNAGAGIVKRLVASAISNARQHRADVDVDTLFVSRASVDQGPNSHLRRWRPRAQGRATRVTKGVSHIQIELDQR
ncbi:MAG TPA: 50S ribosomal protein L22 [Polyangiaceae bacterium]|jgi:large subunit ribosomal protein L22